MVEVALAMAIIAIGISSILVLFPVGINANKSAIANNNIADVAEYITGYLQYAITRELHTGSAMNAGVLGGLPTTLPAHVIINDNGWNPVPGFDNLDADSLSTPTRFRYQQRTFIEAGTPDVYAVDFSAELRLWTQDVGVYYRDFGGFSTMPGWVTTGDGTSPDSSSWRFFSIREDAAASRNDNFERLVFLEVSWPSDVPLNNRERRIYLLDFFNPNRIMAPTGNLGMNGVF